MAYYDALIAAWNNPTQPPPGVTGTGLAPTDTTDQKLTKVNAWTIVGQIPTTIYSSTDQVVNCVVYAEFKALTQVQQANFLSLMNTPGQLKGGSANTADLLVGMIIDYFGGGSQTISNMTKLSQAIAQLWWGVPVANGGAGLSSSVSHNDLELAGLS